MTDLQVEKLNMHVLTLDFCVENEDVYADVPAFGRYVDELKDSIDQTKELSGLQKSVIVQSNTEQKGNAEDELVEAITSTAGILHTYGFETRNTALMKTADVNKNMLYRLQGPVKVSAARNIAKEAAAVIPELAEFGYTIANLQKLTEAIDAYEALIGSPRKAINERKGHTGSLAKQLAVSDSVLYDKLDKLVVLFKTTHPKFYNGYKSARNIIRHGGK